MKRSSSSRISYQRFAHLPFFIFLISALLGLGPPLATGTESEQESVLSSSLLEDTTLADGGFSLSLKLFNPSTELVQSAFFFGDEVGYQINLTIPPAAEGKKATVKLTATVQIGGVTLPFTTSHVFSGPVTNPTREEANLFEPKVWKDKFQIPSDIPVSELTATVKLVATITDIGTSTIKKKITLKTRKKLSKPVLRYPADVGTFNGSKCGTSSYSANWWFGWEEVPGATEYEIMIRNTADGSTGTYATEKKYYWGSSPCKSANIQNWAWKVRAGNEYCWSPWSNERTFTIKGY